MMRKIILLLVVAMLLPWGSVSAQRLYKWVDSNGNVSYHDRPPPADSGYTVEEKRVGAARERARSSADDDAAQKAPVILYVAPKCSSCDLARVHLQKRNIPFTEKNADGDVKVQDELKAKAGSLSVPTIIVGTKVMNGYLESLLDGELDAAGYAKAGEAAGAPTEEGFKAPTQ